MLHFTINICSIVIVYAMLTMNKIKNIGSLHLKKYFEFRFFQHVF